MQSNRILLAVILTGVALSLVLFTRLAPYHFDQEYVERGSVLDLDLPVVKEQSRIGLPVRLKIPKIQVDAAIESVGLTSGGAMDIPKERTNVAWFNLGSRPGEEGSAVIAGHYGWRNSKPSAFDNLHTLRKGDRVSVEDDNGVITFFVVREIRRYDPKANSSDVFGSGDESSHLNLVTCEGTWDNTSNGYLQRLVVFTDKE